MKRLVTLLMLILITVPAAPAQKRKKPRPRPKPVAPAPVKPAASPMVGVPVVIITKNGDRISGAFVDLNAYSIRIKADGLESAIALDTISALSFGATGSAPPREPVRVAASPDFDRDLDSALRAFQSMAAAARPGADYTDYGHQLSELRPQAERFIARYSATENPRELRAAALAAGALTDYAWARTVWTLKLGRTSDGTVAEADSPVLVDLLGLYPDLRSSAASGNRLAADRLIAGLWKKAAEKLDRVRASASPR